MRAANRSDSIPEVIHQIWNDHDIPHDVYRREWIDSWKLHHPDWDYILWTGDTLLDLARAEFPQYEHLVCADVPPIVRADIGRLLILRHFGGLYVDLDYICLRRLAELLEGRTLVVPAVRENCVTNALIASIPDHPVVKACLEEAAVRARYLGRRAVQWICGPQLWRDVLRSNRGADFWIAPPHLLCPADWEAGFDLRRGLSDELIEGAAETWPEAYAVTFWAHNW